MPKNCDGWHGVWKSQKKVSFDIASEASYAYILSGQKFIKNAKNEEFLKVKKTVLPDRSILIGQKLVEMENAEIKIGFLTLLSWRDSIERTFLVSNSLAWFPGRFRQSAAPVAAVHRWVAWYSSSYKSSWPTSSTTASKMLLQQQQQHWSGGGLMCMLDAMPTRPHSTR